VLLETLFTVIFPAQALPPEMDEIMRMDIVNDYSFKS
jgi:hypothetical protein